MEQPDDGRAAIWRQALSIGVATGAYGVSFGALSVAAGLSLAQTCTLSLLMFTGGSQFAFAGVIAAGGAGGAAVATAGLLGARNGFYGLQMAPRLQARGAVRLLAAQLTIDESTAVAAAQLAQRPGRDELARLGFWSTGGAVFVLWNLATLAGGMLGSALGDPRRYGLDAAAAAAFLGLLWPRLRTARPRLVAIAAVLAALGLVPRVPAGLPVLGAAVVAVAIGWKDDVRGASPRRPGMLSS
ncbi:MAG TPA: AzlC family ABC transporter permease [Kineosporiaceae bacterium]|nr:AzlC family ABC transporter permease [Kineosporiaceae bacterium]